MQRKPMLVLAAALAGLALRSPAARAAAEEPGVVYIAADKAAASFARGVPMLERANYKIHASRRDGPGHVEVHTKDTDIFHILTGTATLVTGGTVVGGKEIAPEEIRGTSLTGGETRTLHAGDVIVIPNGTPHWFKQVKAPMTYFTVKVRAEAK